MLPFLSADHIIIDASLGLSKPVDVRIICPPKAAGTAQGIADNLVQLVDQIPDINLFSLTSITFIDLDELKENGTLPEDLKQQQKRETIPAPVMAGIEDGALTTELFLDDRLFTAAYEKRDPSMQQLARGIFAYKLAQLFDIQQRWELTPELLCQPSQLGQLTQDAVTASLYLCANSIWSNFFAAQMAAQTCEALVRPYAVLLKTELVEQNPQQSNRARSPDFESAIKLYVVMASLIGHLKALSLDLSIVLPDLHAELEECGLGNAWERMAAILDDMEALYPQEFENTDIFMTLSEFLIDECERRGIAPSFEK
jgi:hypothetical protein